jgi:hypothetical protein
MRDINSLADLKPGDIMFGPIGGAVGIGVGLGQLALGESVRIGKLSIRHVGIVTEARFSDFRGPGDPPRLVQAMPGGAEEIELREDTHWTERHAYVRMPEDYPGQGGDAAAIARLMVQEGVAYSPASYAALAAWRFGLKTPRLEKWIGRRRSPILVPDTGPGLVVQLPVEAICSVLVDQAWSLAGKRVMQGVAHQAVTPGALALRLWRDSRNSWGGPGLL